MAPEKVKRRARRQHGGHDNTKATTREKELRRTHSWRSARRLALGCHASRKALARLRAGGVKVQLSYVRAHTGHDMNERADELAAQLRRPRGTRPAQATGEMASSTFSAEDGGQHTSRRTRWTVPPTLKRDSPEITSVGLFNKNRLRFRGLPLGELVHLPPLRRVRRAIPATRRRA